MLQLGDKIKFLIVLFLLFACSQEEPIPVPGFDGVKAFQYIEKQCEFGPRNPGSSGHEEFSIYFVFSIKILSTYLFKFLSRSLLVLKIFCFLVFFSTTSSIVNLFAGTVT